MTHIFLYSTATEVGEPSAALQSAVQKMHDLVADLETKHRFVAVQGHSHTVIPRSSNGNIVDGQTTCRLRRHVDHRRRDTDGQHVDPKVGSKNHVSTNTHFPPPVPPSTVTEISHE